MRYNLAGQIAVVAVLNKKLNKQLSALNIYPLELEPAHLWAHLILKLATFNMRGAAMLDY